MNCGLNGDCAALNNPAAGYNEAAHEGYWVELSPARKKARLIWAYLRGHPVFCSWQVTYLCNFRCDFCFYWKEEVNLRRAARERESTLEDFRIASDKLGELGSLIVSLAGGEPCMRRDLPEIVALIAQKHFPLITTNGWLITEQRARDLWQAGLWGASVSLDFADDASHDSHRGIRGATERARGALQLFTQTRTRPYQRVNLMCVLNARNLGQIEDLICLARDYGASFMVHPYATVKIGNTDMAPSAKVSAQLLALKKRFPNFLSNPSFLGRFDQFYAGGIPGCKAGRAFFNIDNFLNVQKCVEFRETPVGNLRELAADQMLRRLQSEHACNTCRACWYNCRGEVEVLYSPRGLLAALALLA